MKTPLSVLIIEDSAEDVTLLERELRRGGFDPTLAQVASAEALAAALERQNWDVVLSDYALPGFSGMAALQYLQHKGIDLPFIVVSGTIGEDVAVEAMKAGASDYIMKDKLARLVPAVKRELREAAGRAARRHAEQALRLLQKADETLPLGVTIADLNGKILYANPTEAAMHGYEVDDLIGKDVRIFSPSTLWRPLTRDEIRVMKTWTRETVNVAKDGRVIPVQLMSNPVWDEAGEPIAIVTICQDITERKRAEAALRASEERYALAARGANDGLWDWDLKTGVMYFAARWKSMLGFEDHEIGTDPEEWFGRVHADDRVRLRREIDSHLAGLTPHYQNEHRMLHKDGRYRWVLSRGVAVRDGSQKAYRLAGSQSDITERKLAEEQLRHDAFYDPLTGLPNRSLFLDHLNGSIARANRRPGYLFAVLFCDLDRFKNVNDSLGHGAGDQLLIEVAHRLHKCLRPGDTVARLGGDEFTILLDDIKDVADVTQVADRIQAELSAPFLFNGQELFSSASIGIALSAARYDRPEDLLRDADTAMYRAKALGKARYQFFDAAMHTRAVSLLQLENDLRHAVERREFVLHYQPIVSLETGEIVALEALVRWRHPERGLVFPKDFIPLAEETGLIIPIGRWVLRQACRQVREWVRNAHGDGRLSVSVNLSARQFTEPALIDEIDRALKDAGVEASRLRLEITETVIMENAEVAAGMLQALRARNVRLDIDDFGTGHSSLSYLHRFPIDTLKIDRSFVSQLGTREENAEIVRTIVTLAHSLDMDVMAEGVETAQQLAQLRSLQCDSGQGRCFSEPLNGEAAGKLLARHPRW